MKKTFIFSLAILLLGIQSFAKKNSVSINNKHRIEFKINGLKDTILTIGYHFGNSKYVADTLQINHDGIAIMQGDSLLIPGIYIAILPDKSNFDFLIDKDQIFSIETSKDNLLGNLKYANSPINSDFNAYQSFMKEMQSRVNAIQERQKKVLPNSDSSIILKKNLIEVDNMVRDKWAQLSDKEKGNLLGILIALIKTPQIPEFDVPSNINNKDSLRWLMGYEYQKKHYWDDINLSDPRILRTPIFESRLNNYFTNIVIQSPDSLKPEIDKIINASSKNKETYQFVVSSLLNHFNQSNIMTHDELFVYISDKYYLSGKTPWASKKLLDDIKKFADNIRPNIVGKIAPNLILESDHGEYIALNQLRNKYTIIYFFEPNCSHCQQETPVLYEFYQQVKDKGVDVYCIYTQYKKEEWQKYLAEKNYEWINVWDANYNSNFRSLYNITSTPTIYLLDKDKKIVAKRISVESLKEILKDLQ